MITSLSKNSPIFVFMKSYYKNYVNRIGIFEGKMLHKVGLVLDAGLV